MKASECKCCICGKQAVAFWPRIDPDIPSKPYCRKCLDNSKLKLLVEFFHYNDSNKMKRIYFYPFGAESLTHNDYIATKDAIDTNYSDIHTASMANFSFDLLDKEYEIYLVSRQNHATKIAPSMPEIDRELRPAHNILKMFLAGVFDSLIYD